MEDKKQSFMSDKMTVTLLLVSLALMLIGAALNYISSTSPSITGMVQTTGASPNLRNLKYLVTGLLIIVILLFLGFIYKKQKDLNRLI